MRAVALLAVLLLTSVGNLETQACSSQNNTPTSDEVFATSDGVRFHVEVVARGLEIPWSLAFAPDGRLFVTERPGRVRIVDISRGTSDVALTVDDVSAEGEGGLLGLAVDPGFT